MAERHNHLHPMLTERRGAYRPCDAPLIAKQVGRDLIQQYSATGSFTRIVSVGHEVNYETVGIIVVDHKTVARKLDDDKVRAWRILYTWMDLYTVQEVLYTDYDYEVVREVDMVDAFALPMLMEEWFSKNG